MLKEEIGESLLRLKAAKFGHAIEDIVPQHSNAFYLPQKSDFEPKINLNSTKQNESQLKGHSRQFSLQPIG
jgi:hypothetical protein